MRTIRPLRIRSDKVRVFLKRSTYILIAAVLYVFMTTSAKTPVKPLLLIPFAVCVSMNESEFASSMWGLFCGFLLDSACGKVFGYNAFVIMVLCMFSSLLFLYLIRRNFFGFFIISAAAIFLHAVLDYFFYYAIWGYENVGLLFWDTYIPQMLWTLACGALLYFVGKYISIKFGTQMKILVEEKNDGSSEE
ncbi:MAG: rod shape-determining protein MreD [Oscillospiraceae bacterium]|nr:rod shape-determining protein MreD [Oscillospiraceae bacterium]